MFAYVVDLKLCDGAENRTKLVLAGIIRAHEMGQREVLPEIIPHLVIHVFLRISADMTRQMEGLQVDPHRRVVVEPEITELTEWVREDDVPIAVLVADIDVLLKAGLRVELLFLEMQGAELQADLARDS